MIMLLKNKHNFLHACKAKMQSQHLLQWLKVLVYVEYRL